MSKKAFITGIAGQDGSYLAEYLLELGYEVFGLVRRTAQNNTQLINLIRHDINLIDGDLEDIHSFSSLIKEQKFDEIYNLGALSHVHYSFACPDANLRVNAGGPLNILECIRKFSPDTKFIQAGTSELFGKVLGSPQTETTPFNPQSPYAVAKLYAHYITKLYRKAYNLFACNSICFNHESPRRGSDFVTKKIIHELVNICKGRSIEFEVGNLEAKRDWGYAADYVKGMHLMLQYPTPNDYILATGETHTVRELIELTCQILKLKLRWEGSGLKEIGYITLDGNTDGARIIVSEKFYRPAEVDLLLGDYTKANKILNWEPKTKFKELIELMVKAEWGGTI